MSDWNEIGNHGAIEHYMSKARIITELEQELADLKRLVREFIEIVDSTMHHKSEFVFYLKKRDEVKQAVKEE